MARGGARHGAGRKPRLKASLVDQGAAARILKQIDEEAKWLALLIAKDERLQFDALRYLTNRRDGMPNQPHTGPDGGPIEVAHTIKFGNGNDPHKP